MSENESKTEESKQSKTDDELYIRLNGPVTDSVKTKIIAQAKKAKLKDVSVIYILLDSQGGNVSATYETIVALQELELPVVTYNSGTLDLVGIMLYCVGGLRIAAENTFFLMHPIKKGQVSETEQSLDEFDAIQLREILSELQANEQAVIEVVKTAAARWTSSVLRKVLARSSMDTRAAKKFGLVQEIRKLSVPSNATVVDIP